VIGGRGGKELSISKHQIKIKFGLGVLKGSTGKSAEEVAVSERSLNRREE